MTALTAENLLTEQEVSSAFQPILVTQVELSSALPTINAAENGRVYRRTRILVRLHTYPLGVIDLSIAGNQLTPAEYVDTLWQHFHQAINAHLRRNGLPLVEGLDVNGLRFTDEPHFLKARREFRARAPFVSVAVVTRNRSRDLEKCVSALLNQNYPDYEIIVIDNAPSNDTTQRMVQEKFGHRSQVRYVREDRPGTPWARQRGLLEARGEIMASTDDDAVADPNWLLDIVRPFAETENVACVTGFTMPAEIETQAQAWFEQFGGFNKGRGYERMTFNLKTHRLRDPLYPYQPAVFGAGVNMAFRTEALRKVGGFNPVFLTGQDVEAFFRLVMNGYTIVYEPGAIVSHFHRREFGELRDQLYRYGQSFTCFLTACLVEKPWRIVDMAVRLPYAVYYFLSPHSKRNQTKQRDYPEELNRAATRGMLEGPMVYFRNRRQAHDVARQFGVLDN